MWRRRISTGTRWGTTLASVVIGVMWVGSECREPGFRGDFLGWYTDAYLRPGAVDIYWCDSGAHYPRAQVMELERTQFSWPLDAIRHQLWNLSARTVGSAHFVRIPVYLPLLLTLAPAAFLWHREIRRRRVRVGVCSGCGYDRAGLAVGVKCPECGRGLLIP